ncbi:unnamed protein product [Cylicocyclus nassatus]|uniref:SCP domain-containing protein n=1 Tax=Cylicocyclus nassatus TaxID=53992 RepID=A0AA36GZ26_CYLNA|nr:unnamed protein product [Cylicocyclus nassatus]
MRCLKLCRSSNDAEVGNAYKFPAKSVFLTFIIVLIVALIVSVGIFFVIEPRLDKLTGSERGEHPGKPTDAGGGYGGDIPNCGTSMTAKQRATLLEIHNKYRSEVAKGEYTIKTPKGKFRSLPPATRMYKLKYNCSLENTAVKWAIETKCKMVHTKGASYGENLFLAWGDTRPNRSDYAAAAAPSSWSEEIRKFGISTLDEWRFEIGHATQIFTARMKWIGCGIHNCANNVSLVCHYYPGGNIIGVDMYTPGKTLSECGKNASNENPDENTGLCIWS